MSVSTALIIYTPPMTAIEFVESEAKKANKITHSALPSIAELNLARAAKKDVGFNLHEEHSFRGKIKLWNFR